MCPDCGVETFTAVTPGGREVELDHAHVWVRKGEPWPTRVFIIGIAPAGQARMKPYATPAVELYDRPENGETAGPFRRPHDCPWR